MSRWKNVEKEESRQELVKCVVVGDTAVGKTRLICARACDIFLNLSQVLTTHIPTIWAIDQYRNHKEVLQRSFKNVDGVNVSLRLWDTFGDHEKDRKFAYGRSDVVVLCFSVSNQLSLRHCKTKWYPEIKRYCPRTPILLVGCKNDLRHIYRDKNFLALCREKGQYVKILQESDLITCEQGRNLAEELDVPYYETSVVTQYGIAEVFENAIRLALITRRESRFFSNKLRNVQSPTLQKPFCPPPPPKPDLDVTKPTYCEEMLNLLKKSYYSDVRLVAGKSTFNAHSTILAASSSYFKNLFTLERTNSVHQLTTFHWMSPSTMEVFLTFLYSGSLIKDAQVNLQHLLDAAVIIRVKELEDCVKNFQDDEEYLNADIQKKFITKMQIGMREICVSTLGSDVIIKLDNGIVHASRAIMMARCDVMAAMFGGDFKESSAKVVQFPGISKQCFLQLLMYLYSNRLDKSLTLTNYLPLIVVANRLCLLHLLSSIEKFVVHHLTETNRKGTEISEHVCTLLEAVQVHNAKQLAEWCQHYISVNYQEVAINYSGILRHMQPENQAILNKNRWPPASYVKELEFHERCLHERQLKEKPQQYVRWKKASQKINTFLSVFKINRQQKGLGTPTSVLKSF